MAESTDFKHNRDGKLRFATKNQRKGGKEHTSKDIDVALKKFFADGGTITRLPDEDELHLPRVVPMSTKRVGYGEGGYIEIFSGAQYNGVI